MFRMFRTKKCIFNDLANRQSTKYTAILHLSCYTYTQHFFFFHFESSGLRSRRYTSTSARKRCSMYLPIICVYLLWAFSTRPNCVFAVYSALHICTPLRHTHRFHSIISAWLVRVVRWTFSNSTKRIIIPFKAHKRDKNSVQKKT